MANKYLDAYLQQRDGNSRKQDEKNNSTSSTGRGAGSAAASGRSGNGLDFLQRLQNETRGLYSQSPQMQGSLYAQIAQQMRGNAGGASPSPTYTQQGSLYAQAAQQPAQRPVAMPGLGGAQRQMIAERTTPTGDTWEDANALARETQQQSRPSYFQLLERNINAAAADPYGGVTPQMVAELRQADDERREAQRQNFQQLERDIAAQGNLYSQAAARVTPGLTGAQRQMIAERGEALSEDADLREVKARLPGLQYTYEAAKNNYQQLMDRNIRLANETGEVSPEQVAELYRAEQAMKQAQQRYNDALARNEEMSYSEKMGGIKTDLSGIAQLLDDRARFEAEAGMQRASGMNDLAADFDRQKEEADAKIEAVREQLRQEGYSDKEIQALFDYQVKLKNAAEMEDRYNKYYSEAVGNSDFENWLLNTSTGLVSGVGYLDLAGQMLMGKIQGADPITGQTRVLDYNTGAQAPHAISEAVMQGEMDKLLKKYGVEDENGEITGMSREGRIRAGAYQLSVSMGQSAAVAGLTALGAPCAMLLLSGNAATQTVHQMHEAGYSDGDAMLMGAISGAAEYVTEKIGMDKLFQTRDISTAKNVVKTLLGNIVNQSMAEGGEEVLSTVINTLADLLVNKDKSELALRYRELLAQGMTPEEAELAAAREWMQGAWQDFYMGAISGGLFGMGGTAFVSGRNAITDRQTGQKIIEAGTVQDVLDAARKLDGKISDAAAMPEISDTPSAREMGAAQRGLERAQAMENMRSELEARGEENITPELLSALYNSSLQQEQRLTREEQRAMQGSRTAMELAAEWSEQWGDNSVPAPFEGLEDILRAQMEEKENAPTGQTGPYASIETLPDGRQYVKADREVIYGNDPESWGEQITEYINGKIRNGEDVPVTTVDGDTLLLTADTAGKAAFRNYVDEGGGHKRLMTDEEYEAKISAEAHIDELAKASEMRDRAEPPVPDRGGLHDFAKDGWKYRTVFFRDFDGKYYKITLSTGLRDGAFSVYNVGVMEETPFPSLSGYGTNKGRAGNGASADTVTQSAGNGNTNLQTEVENNGEQSAYGTPENGNDGVRAGEQGQLPGQREGAQPGGQSEVRQGLGQSDVEGLRGQDVTPAQLGIRTGSSETAVHIQTEEEMSERAKEAEDLARSQGYTAVPFTGTLGLGDGHANAVIQDGMICYRTDAVDRNGDPIDPVSLVEHEFTHPFTEGEANRERRNKGMEIIGKHYSQKVIEKLKAGYRETYKDIYDFEGMSEDDIAAAIENELFGDAYSGLGFFKGDEELKGEMHQAFPEIQQGQSQTQQSGNETRGPPRAAIASDFLSKFQDWVHRGKPDRGSIRVGTTSRALQSVGVDPKNIWWDYSKMNKIMRDHPEIDETILSQVPDILERPIIIMESKTQPNRVTMFGEVYGKNGLPVMAVLELLPTKKGGRELNLIKVANSYTKSNDAHPTNNQGTQQLINESNILYVEPNKNRTAGWLSRTQLQLPFGDNHYGSIGKITLTHRDVNGNFSAGDTTGSSAFKEALKAAAEKRKSKQWEIIQKANPMRDDIHAGIRSAEDIRTFEEALEDDGIGEGDVGMAPDITAAMIENAKKTGEITVYSSKPIQEGSFVTPSAMEAKSYAGSGPIYSETVSTDDVAWLDSIQGQYAPVKGPGRASAEVDTRAALEQEYKERTEAYLAASNRNDTEYDYAGEMARIQELEKRLKETNPPQTAQSAASSPEGALSGDPMAELMEVGEATVENDSGKYTLQVRRKGEGYQARISRDGRLDRVQTFETPQEAAEYALSYVDGQTQARTDAELDNERSEQRERPGPHWPTGREFSEEIIRQKENKAAEAATQTLKERIRRADEELRALRRLDKTTGLTAQQRAHMNDVQETLDIMNDELTRRKGRRKAKKEAAGKVTENKPTRSAAEAKNALMDLFHTAAGERAEVGRQIEAKLAEIARTGKITEESRQALYDMLIENGVVPRQAESTYREIRNWLRGQRIYVNEQERADLGDDFEALRRRAWGAGIYLTNDIRDGRIDGVNGELAETFGENMFPTDEALSDMLNNMIDLADKGRTTQQTLHEAIRGEARETGQSASEIYADMFNRMDETLRTFAEKAGLEVDLKDRTATQLAEERKRWEDRMERRAQARRESEIRGKVLRGLQRLSKLRGKAGPEIRTQVDEVLQDIDTQARQITPAGLENLQALQRAYEEAREKAGYVDGENMGNWIPNPYVEERLAALGKKHLNDMSLEDVIELGRTVSALENTIRTQNQMIGEEFDATIESYANGVRQEVESAKGAKAGFLHKWLKEEHLSPRRFLDMLGGWTDGSMKKLSQSLESGQTRMLDFQRRATQSFDSFLSRKANRQWLEKASGKKAEWTKYTVLDGVNEDGASYTDIELTPMMKISLFLHSRNMDNLRHIQTGGIVIPNKALYQQGKMAEAYAQGKRVKMNPETVRKIAGELTETERTFANHMITVFDQISKDAINEVSLQLDGFERAGVENYMPIETDRNFLKSDVAGEARAQTVEGIGSIANERIHASNPVMLSDASDVLMRQIDKVSRYYGYAIPIRNFQAVNNYVFHEEGAPFSTSVKEIMNKKWGAGAEQYITKMLEDLQSSGRRGDMMSSALAKLRGNLAGATLMFNPSVAVSQTASYPGAAQAVGWDGLAHGLVAGRVDPKLIEKYTPLYWYRNQGNSTQELGDYMSSKGMAQKLPWILNWIQKMDSATVRRLWAASEYRVSKDNPGLKPGSRAGIDAGTDAYYRKVAEVFNRAVYDTQPNYTNMERAQILRSNSDLTKFLTMYKTVPLQYYGMMVEATGRLQAAVKSGDQTKIAEARKYAANTFGGLLAANTVYVAVKALFKGLRKKDKDYRDEEGNLTAGSVAAQLGKDLAETYAGSIIGGAEMYSAAESLLTGSKFYGPEMSALSYVEDMVNAVGKVTDAIGDEDPRKAAGAIKDAALSLAKGFGVPAENMETYLMAGVRWLFPDVAMEYDNMFGGIQRADLKSMDTQAVSTATNLILQNRTGLKIDQSVTDELARLYSAGELAAVPTETPTSFTYNGKTVEIEDRGAYSDTWGAVVGDNLEELVTADDYVAADDGRRAALVNKLYQYATVEARREADPEYSADGNSTYGWTVKADEAVEAGVDLVDAICALDAFGHMTADKDEFGNSISGSKKAKVCEYIDAMDITDEQKDVMYLLAGYKENSLEYTPWHGYEEDGGSGSGSGSSGSGKGSGKSSGKSSGGKRSGGRGGSRKAAAKEKAVKGSGKIQLPKVSSGSGGAGKVQTPKGSGKGADASMTLIEIIDKYYGGNALAAAMDGGARARGRTEVDFEL